MKQRHRCNGGGVQRAKTSQLQPHTTLAALFATEKLAPPWRGLDVAAFNGLMRSCTPAQKSGFRPKTPVHLVSVWGTTFGHLETAIRSESRRLLVAYHSSAVAAAWLNCGAW